MKTAGRMGAPPLCGIGDLGDDFINFSSKSHGKIHIEPLGFNR